MTEYPEHIKSKHDYLTWFAMLMVRIALTEDEQEQKELFSEVASITDEYPELRDFARKAGVTGVLPNNIKVAPLRSSYER